MKKVLYLDKEPNPTTGGHKYNTDLLNVLEKECGFEIDYSPRVHLSYDGECKLIIPFRELKWLKKIKESDYVFFRDTAFRYHFLLLLFAKLFTNTKCLIIVHHYSYLGLKGPKRWARYIIERTYNYFSHYIIYPNPFIYEIGSHFFPKSKIVYIPTHLDNTICNVTEEMRSGLLFVGTIEQRKGLHLLIKSMDYIVNQEKIDLQLSIVGKIVNNTYYNSLVEYVELHNLKKNVRFLGRLSDDDLDSYYRKSKLFVFPSLLEGYGLVLIEAMKYGLPVIAFNNSAMPYTIKDGINGFLARNEDYRDFAEKIIHVEKNGELLKELQQGAYKTMEQVQNYEDFKKALVHFINKTL